MPYTEVQYSPLHYLLLVIHIGCDFVSIRAGCSIPVSNCPDACDSLHITNLALDVDSILWMLILLNSCVC